MTEIPRLQPPLTPSPAGPKAPRLKPSFTERVAIWRDSDLWLSFKASPVAIVSAAVTLLIILMALLADVLAPQDAFDPVALNLLDGFAHPMERGCLLYTSDAADE